MSIEKLRQQAIPGCLTSLPGNEVFIGEKLTDIKDLDEIPSPYLTGLFDPFCEEAIIPLIETNRSCPYRCTFCAWGIGSHKLTQFSNQRLFDEIEYIGKRCKKSAL